MRGLREIILIYAAILLVVRGHRHYESESDKFYADTSVSIRTSSLTNAGADGRVYLRLHGKNKKTSEIVLPQDLINGVIGEIFGTGVFVEGSTVTFDIVEADKLDTIDFVEIYHKPALFSWHDEWRPQLLTFRRKSLDGAIIANFPIDRYLKPKKRYLFSIYDTHLPQNDPLPEQRQQELAQARKEYEYDYHKKDFPPRVKKVPFDQMYTDGHLVRMFKGNLPVGSITNLQPMLPDKNFTSFKEIEDTFAGILRKPKYVSGFRDDVWFGRQRVQGGDPVLIQLINRIPNKLGVTPGLVKGLLDNLTLHEALVQNKIFMTDLDIFDSIRDTQKIQMTEPIALFYLNQKKDLMPIAIQLFQKKSKTNPVFTPNDDENTWLLVKFYYNLAESTHHQAVSHLSFTHYLMEPIIINTHRNLAPSHPIFRLLAPHFLFTLPINRLAISTFDNAPKVDKAMNACSRGMMFLVGRGYKRWNLTKHATIENLFKEHRVTKDILPYYPFRDDITKVYKMLHRYVTKIIHLYYDGEDIKKDKEIQAWRHGLSHSIKHGGLGLKGIPGSDKNGLTTIDQLIQTVTGIIFMASGWHAAVNFLMYDTIAFPPNYPVFLRGEIPSDKRHRKEEEIMSYMPSSRVMYDTITVANSLAIRDTNGLGNFETPKLYHPEALKAVQELRDECAEITAEIDKIDKDRPVSYPWGRPLYIPNAISV